LDRLKRTIIQRISDAWRASYPNALKIAWWMIRLTVLVSVGVEVLRYFGIIDWMSEFLSPVFRYVGLPGEASLIFLTGYFVNVYASLAVLATFSLDARAITILAIMVLCAHNMIVETAVQRKCGSSAVRMVALRTMGALAGGLLANWLLPSTSEVVHNAPAATQLSLPDLALAWFLSAVKLTVRMVVLIVALSFLQRLLAEFGVIRWLSKILRPMLIVFGLPAKTSFLWIVANILGLAYGAAVMIEETEQGKISRTDADLLNHHIAVSHSNLEDLLLFISFGALGLWVLLLRWALSIVSVWARRLELAVRARYGTNL